MRTIGIVRARVKIGLQNLVYNIRRLVTLESMAAVKQPARGPGTERPADTPDQAQISNHPVINLPSRAGDNRAEKHYYSPNSISKHTQKGVPGLWT